MRETVRLWCAPLLLPWHSPLLDAAQYLTRLSAEPSLLPDQEGQREQVHCNARLFFSGLARNQNTALEQPGVSPFTLAVTPSGWPT